MTFTTAWVLGESDDHIEAIFLTEGAARAYAAAKGIDLEGWESHWWLDECPLEPKP